MPETAAVAWVHLRRGARGVPAPASSPVQIDVQMSARRLMAGRWAGSSPPVSLPFQRSGTVPSQYWAHPRASDVPATRGTRRTLCRRHRFQRVGMVVSVVIDVISSWWGVVALPCSSRRRCPARDREVFRRLEISATHRRRSLFNSVLRSRQDRDPGSGSGPGSGIRIRQGHVPSSLNASALLQTSARTPFRR